MKNIAGLIGVGGLAGALVFATPSTAEACGGTFCEPPGGATPMPVDQTGENILFVMAGDYTEAHIQIQYDPNSDAEAFSWVVPLTDVPEFGVGSELLFDAVLGATVPRYGFDATSSCGDPSAGSASDGGSESDGDFKLDLGSGGPDILLQEVVGAFEITVLSGEILQEIKDWLDANGYAQDPNADPILQEYLDEGYVFAAFKLTNDAETSEIHPITLRFPNDEACIPIRLTRIAAVDDMDIRSFFLSDARVVPSTYKHVLVNPLRLDWPNLAANYKSVVTQAVDADEAGGRAFVTEYAGPSDVVPTAGLLDDEWGDASFVNAAPSAVMDVLQDHGLASCFEQSCEYNHPLLLGLLRRFVPVPDGVDEAAFYACLSCYEDMIDAEAWDAAAFSDALDDRIIEPGIRAVEMLEQFPYLTRMYTTMSPGEMTEDPFFHQNPDLAEVDLTDQRATRTSTCVGVVWTLPDGREVFSNDGSWPEFPNEMPWEEEVAEMMQAGAPNVLVNRTETIDAQLSQHNCGFNWPSPEACGNPTDGSTSDPSDDGTGSTGDEPSALDDDGGCSCSTGRMGQGWFALFLVTVSLRRRRSLMTPTSEHKPTK